MAILYVICALLALQIVLFYMERKDLYHRLQSKDLRDYQSSKWKPPDQKKHISAHKRTLERWKRGADE